jgi:hypothetical protein
MRIVTLTAALLLSTAAAHAATPVKPCDLLSQSAAASLWGGAIESVRPLGEVGCSYERPHDEFVLTQIYDAHSWGSNAPMMFKMLLGGTPSGGTGEPIPGLGEMATFTSASPEADGKVVDYMVSVYGHGHALKITVRRSTNPHLKQDLIQAAKQIFAKLQ